MRWSRTFTVIGVHAEGEVGDVLVGGRKNEDRKNEDTHSFHCLLICHKEPGNSPYR